MRQHTKSGPLSPDEKLGKFASAYVIAARFPAIMRSLQCSTLLSIEGLASTESVLSTGNSASQTYTRARHLVATEKSSSDSGCFDKQQSQKRSQRPNLTQHRVLSLQGLRRFLLRRVHCFSLRPRSWPDMYHSHFQSNSKFQTTIYLPDGPPICCT